MATAQSTVRARGTSGVVVGGSGGFPRWFRATGWRHLVAWIALVFAVYPVLWIISAALNPLGTLTSQSLIPSRLTLDNFRQLFTPAVPFGAWYLNTVLIAAAAGVLNTFLSALAAYSFSRMRFRGRRAGLLSVLLVQMFPQALAFVAIFLMIVAIGDVFPAIGLGSRLGLTLVYLGGAMSVNTWLMKGFYDTIPVELDESAKVDGAGHGQIFFRIIMPLVAPILAVVFLLSFIFTFNEFLIASAVLGQGDPDQATMAVGLYRYVNDQFNLRWGPFAAGSLLAGIPVVIVFQLLQRYIVGGLTQGAVKG
jgi:arabinogalactan oligomer/maltooligosaccharide transport system permease protein